MAYEASENSQEALEIFKTVYEMDKTFREVSSKVDALGNNSKKRGETEAIPSMDNALEVELL
ncbi:MAG: hypothetical protein A3A85_09015 [Deltaproteobacteria bacterium RIFCSPLOWO2_01_FULL_42_9]|nr:MAG: hypothetical protein A3A85_09015 [Deltaproteobacteria bacterium RIFCSPLOWO2_01_FULL_42_9]